VNWFHPDIYFFSVSRLCWRLCGILVGGNAGNDRDRSYGEKFTRSGPSIFAAFGIIRPFVDLIGWRRRSTAASKRRRWAMSNVTKFALSAAISQHRFFGAGGKQAWSYQGAGS
jgi:hypothetical protein